MPIQNKTGLHCEVQFRGNKRILAPELTLSFERVKVRFAYGVKVSVPSALALMSF